MNKPSIQPIHADDYGAVHDIYLEAIEAGWQTADLLPMALEERLEWYKNHSQEPYLIYTLKIGEDIIGYCYISPWRGGRLALRSCAEVSFYLRQDQKRKGYGSLMVEFILDEANRLGFESLIAILISENENSIYLFLKYGFHEWGRLPGVVQFADGEADHVILGRPI